MIDVPHWAQIEMDIEMKMALLELLIAKKQKDERAAGLAGLQRLEANGFSSPLKGWLP